MKKKQLTKTATLEKVIEAINNIKAEIRFVRTDSIDMEEHINNKIGLMETRLRHQAELNHSEIMDKLGEVSETQKDTQASLKKIEQIHPNYTHATI